MVRCVVRMYRVCEHFLFLQMHTDRWFVLYMSQEKASVPEVWCIVVCYLGWTAAVDMGKENPAALCRKAHIPQATVSSTCA